jgi:hypothetical protein
MEPCVLEPRLNGVKAQIVGADTTMARCRRVCVAREVERAKRRGGNSLVRRDLSSL